MVKRKYSEESPRISRQFSEFTKLVQNHFPKVSVDIQIFQKTVPKLTENFPKNNRSRVLSIIFSRDLQLPEVFREFCDNFGERAFSVLFSS